MGGPPSQGELENWLVAVRGLTREEAREIALTYITTGIHMDPGLDQMTLGQWVDNAIQTNTARGTGDQNGHSHKFPQMYFN